LLATADGRLVACGPRPEPWPSPPAHDQAEAVAERLDAAALWPAVAEAINQLPTGERDALNLHVWEGLSYLDVAASLEVPVGTVRSRLNRARRRIRELTGTSGQELLIR
jgi:RNA polymerase sigma factor (sigma-70 family)